MTINNMLENLEKAQEYIWNLRITNASCSLTFLRETCDAIWAAMEYIKKEQPRILRYRELPPLISDGNTVVYVEHKDDNEKALQSPETIQYTLVTACTVSSVTLCDGFCEEQEMEREDYNKTWRCWNKIPSPVQRNEPWDCDMD